MSDPIEDRLQTALQGVYHIERELGRGAMARVFKADDVRHGRTVAVKLLPPELATAASAQRFLREIQITAALQHPHILPLLDSGAGNGLCWFVMPFVEGVTIREYLAEGPLPLKDAAKWAHEAAQALAYAHKHGVLHRDIKPENIMISGGHATVMDFGLGKALGNAGSKLTMAGMPLGTPAYMSPEQVSGSGEVDARSDLYGLGCVYYEMVTGQPPFTGSMAKVMQMHMHGEAAPPSTLRKEAPEVLDKMIAKLLAKAPEDRYQDGESLAEDLEMVRAVITLGVSPTSITGEVATAEEKGGGGWRRLFGKR